MTETKPRDPAEAAAKALELVGPDVAAEFTEAAARDICRRAAHDMGITERNAHPAMLPTIAAEAAARMMKEAEPAMLKLRKAALQEALDEDGWRKADYSGRTWTSPWAQFTMEMDAEAIKIHLSRKRLHGDRAPIMVETLILDQPSMTPRRLVRILDAAK